MNQSKSEWYISIKKNQYNEFGSVVPPWTLSPNSHPISIEWRMGAGETNIMVFSIWWDLQKFSQKDAIEYFKKFLPPPRWMMWMADVLWEMEICDPDEFENSSFYNMLFELGFENVKDFKSDFENPKWLK